MVLRCLSVSLARASIYKLCITTLTLLANPLSISHISSSTSDIQCTFHGVDNSVTSVSGVASVDVGPPQTQVSGTCSKLGGSSDTPPVTPPANPEVDPVVTSPVNSPDTTPVTPQVDPAVTSPVIPQVDPATAQVAVSFIGAADAKFGQNFPLDGSAVQIGKSSYIHDDGCCSN
jgi:hypothetical protein